MIARVATRAIGPLALLLIGLLFWQWRVHANHTPSWFLPPPRVLGSTLVDGGHLRVHNAWVTLKEVLAGFAIAVILGVLLAILIHGSRILEGALYPIVISSQAIPLIAL